MRNRCQPHRHGPRSTWLCLCEDGCTHTQNPTAGYLCDKPEMHNRPSETVLCPDIIFHKNNNCPYFVGCIPIFCLHFLMQVTIPKLLCTHYRVATWNFENFATRLKRRGLETQKAWCGSWFRQVPPCPRAGFLAFLSLRSLFHPNGYISIYIAISSTRQTWPYYGRHSKPGLAHSSCTSHSQY